MDEYLAASGFAGDVDGPLFRTTGRATEIPRRMVQKDAYIAISNPKLLKRNDSPYYHERYGV